MDAEQLLQHFDRVAEAPGSIAALRRFILDLAVRGKLVDQDPNDELASELLKRIQVEKIRLTENGKLRKERSNVLVQDDDSKFTLPTNWQWSQLSQIGVISPRNEADSELMASFISMPLISAEYGIPPKHEIRAWGDIKSGYTHFAEGDVGLAKITPCFENRKSTIFRNLTGGFGAGTTELHVVRPILVDANYVLLFLKCPYFVQNGIPRMTGTAGQKRVPSEYFGYSPFPLPPLSEQHRIIAKVDELMDLCDRLETAQKNRENLRDRLVAASLHQLNQAADSNEEFFDRARFYFDNLAKLSVRSEHIKQLRQTILELAIQGKLIPQDLGDEPSSELLKRIQMKKEGLIKDGILKKEKNISPFSSESKLFAIPPGWKWANFSEYALNISTGPFGSILHQSDYILNGIPLVNPSHMINGRITPDKKVTVSQETANRLDSFRLHKGNIVIARRGEVGRAAIVSELEDGWLCGTGSFFLEFTENNCSEYIIILFKCQFVRKYLAGEAVGITMVNLNHGILKKMPMAVPPLAEQYRIVAKVNELIVLCDQLEVQLSNSQNSIYDLLKSLINKTLIKT
jgi:type I restriction enzyme, S subunit